ncbi:hypothetical protein AB0D67_32950 [Streptosporangium sp. NPDC048047]|uniref:hypothetical protein n=1 Tax=Streptosporangium sp. NPDC048047 TaxID=3155748 RepID=UPI00341F3F84
MRIDRRTLVSAAVVGVVLAGGVSVAAAASAGRLGGDAGPTKAGEPAGGPVETTGPSDVAPADPLKPGETASPLPSPTGAAPSPEDYVVSRRVNPDPRKAAEYWTESRLEQAEPFPMPAAEGPVNVTE